MIENETMELNGGWLEYQQGARLGDGIPPYGRKVKFLGRNGRDHDLNYALKSLKPDDILTIKEIYVDRYASEVEFVEYPGKRFNTVMFSDIAVFIKDETPVYMGKQSPDFTVDTPNGKIEVFSSTNPDYPGIYVDINGVQRVLIDHLSDTKETKIRVWEDEEDPSYVYSVPDNE